MNCKIDFEIFTNNNKEFEKTQIDGIFIPNEKLTFEENTIYLKEKKYHRKTSDYEMIIDFVEKLCEIKYEQLTAGKFELPADINIEDEKIILEYSLGEEQKKIVILLKEVIL